MSVYRYVYGSFFVLDQFLRGFRVGRLRNTAATAYRQDSNAEPSHEQERTTWTTFDQIGTDQCFDAIGYRFIGDAMLRYEVVGDEAGEEIRSTLVTLIIIIVLIIVVITLIVIFLFIAILSVIIHISVSVNTLDARIRVRQQISSLQLFSALYPGPLFNQLADFGTRKPLDVGQIG